MLQCWRGTGHFFCPHPGGFDSSRVPTPGNLPSKAKKNAYARWWWGACGIDWCITLLYTIFDRRSTPFAYLVLRNFTTFTYLSVEIWRIRHKNISSQVPPLFHSYKIHLVSPLGPFSRPKCQISIPLPFHHQLVKSYPFHIPNACLKKVPLSEGASPYRPF